MTCKWDIELCCDIFESWFGTIDQNGWIPPEQARGRDITKDIPIEFLAIDEQTETPPVLLMPLKLLLGAKSTRAAETLTNLHTDMVRWFAHYE